MIENLSIPGVWTFTPVRREDPRGWFAETFNTRTLEPALGDVSFVQDNQVRTHAPLTLRGMHFQRPPKAQDKLIRALKGAVLDVVVDLRRSSKTYGKWLSVELSDENGVQLFVPKGLAHGYLTLVPDTEVLYKVSDFYSREHEGGVAWDDPDIGIDWGAPLDKIVMADRDRQFPRLSQLDRIFS